MRKLIPTLVSLAFFGTAQLAALDLSLACEPYADSGLYNRPLLPNEGDKVTFGVQCSVDGKPEAAIECEINLADADGETVHKERKELALGEGTAGVEFQWVAASNGLYKLRAVLDPDNKLAETNEDNNTAEIQLPVIVKGRRLFFAWYRYSQWTRWANVATSVGDDAPDLARRGIIPLAWEYGGKSWDKFDNSRFDAEPEAAMKELQETFYKKFAWRELGSHAGVGIDETGGYPGTHSEMRSIASMRGLVQAKKERPERFFAVWHGGGVRNPVAGLYRRGADLLLLETYIWRAVPDALGMEDAYQTIRDRLDPVIRSTDMLIPCYGNHCHTLIALDTSERVDYVHLGEQEQVVRFIRRICPEMRGVAFYNGGYGGYGLERSETTDRKHEAVVRNADRLCFEYYVKPCVTFLRESLWLHKEGPDYELTAAVSNIGGMNSGPIKIAFMDGQKRIGEASLKAVPAGANRNQNRLTSSIRIKVEAGRHDFSAVILEAPGATILDGCVTETRVIP